MPAPPPGPVAFDYALWSAQFPELAPWVSREQALNYFARTRGVLSNTARSPVRDNAPGGLRATLLNLLVAHLAKLYAPLGGAPAPGLVGRISSASEGGVSVTAEMGPLSKSEAWYYQTPYGAEFWENTRGYRTARWNAGPQPYLGVGGGPNPNGWFG